MGRGSHVKILIKTENVVRVLGTKSTTELPTDQLATKIVFISIFIIFHSMPSRFELAGFLMLPF